MGVRQLTWCRFRKSKLRGKDPATLGPQYKGARVSRAALEESDDNELDSDDDDEESDDEYADPNKVDIEGDMKRGEDADSDIDSDNAFGEGDEERFKGYTFRGSSKRGKKRPTAADFMSDSEAEKVEGQSEDGEEDSDEDDEDDGAALESSGSDDDSMNGVDDESDSGSSDDSDGGALVDSDVDVEDADESEESESDQRSSKKAPTSDAADSKKKSVLAAISDSVRQDVEKGLAVREQRKIFDGLLNLRVRLQKALVAVNTLGHVEGDDSAGREAYEPAEEAALKLWSTIDDLRWGIKGSKAGEKRKRDVDLSTSTAALWGYTNEDEQSARQQRRKTLDKWSGRIGATTVPVGNKLNLNAGTRHSISSMLEEQLVDPERLVRRSRVPRSCAPLQAGKGVKEDAGIYDDADFYQLLLKELVDQRTADSEAAQSAGVATVQWAAMKEAKTTKVVDRRASRGRKMRFTVHEKLAGFMAAEDRRSWEDDAIHRFFGTLFGRKMELDEDDEESEEEINAEEAGLMLFRS